MAKKTTQEHRPSAFLQLTVNFVLPIIILTRFSSESSLGPIRAMLLALAFPVAFEIYNVYKRKKVSILSVIAIGGILVTGAISLLGLSEEWLAVRRSIPYIAAGVAILISVWIKRSLLDSFLPRVIDMEKVMETAEKKQTSQDLKKLIRFTSYFASILFIAIGIASYILTRKIIDSPTGTPGFNEDYARLRILALPFTTAPLFVGIIGITMYMFSKLEKLTGLELDTIVHKK